MKNFQSIDEILDFAADLEQKAVEFYNGLAKDVESEEMKSIFEEYAREEMRHKALILKIKAEGKFEVEDEKIQDLKIADYQVHVVPDKKMTYQDALVLAMKREKASFKLYTKLQEKAPNKDIKKLFFNLAQEEAKHKLRFELEYDEFVLKEN